MSNGPLYERYRDAHRTIVSADGSANLQRVFLVADNDGALRRLDRLERIAIRSPHAIALSTENHLEILKLLECCGAFFASAQSPAAEEGVRIFRMAREFALGCDHPWIGVDWDFTTDVYRIYAPLFTLLRLKWTLKRNASIDERWLRSFEVAKPGVHELLFGLAVGYALRQGIARFGDWEQYQPQVRWVTQTWSSRLALMATHVVPLVPLLMGRFPGGIVTADDVRRSSAFITIEDFFAEVHRLLARFRDSGYRLDRLEAYEQEELSDCLKAQKVYQLKPLGAFASKGWSRPTLLLDDSIGSNGRMQRAGVVTIQTVNPIERRRDISDTQTVCFAGKTVAELQILKMVSKTEGPALVDALRRVAGGEPHVVIDPAQLDPLPKGAVIVLNDISVKLQEAIASMREPQVEVRRRVQEITGEMRRREAAPRPTRLQQP